MSINAWIARVLDDRLDRRDNQPAPLFRLVTVGGEGVQPGVGLDRPRELLAAEDDARCARTLRTPVSTK